MKFLFKRATLRAILLLDRSSMTIMSKWSPKMTQLLVVWSVIFEKYNNESNVTTLGTPQNIRVQGVGEAKGDFFLIWFVVLISHTGRKFICRFYFGCSRMSARQLERGGYLVLQAFTKGYAPHQSTRFKCIYNICTYILKLQKILYVAEITLNSGNVNK